jgi:hypothetical protein
LLRREHSDLTGERIGGAVVPNIGDGDSAELPAHQGTIKSSLGKSSFFSFFSLSCYAFTNGRHLTSATILSVVGLILFDIVNII